MQRHHEAVRADPRQLLHYDRVVDEIDSGAAVFSGRVGAEKPGLAHLAPARPIAHPGAIPFGDLRLDLAIDEPAHLRAEHLVLVSKNISSHHCGITYAALNDRTRIRLARLRACQRS